MINPYQGGKVICMRAVIASMLLSYDMSASFSCCNKAMGWDQHVPALLSTVFQVACSFEVKTQTVNSHVHSNPLIWSSKLRCHVIFTLHSILDQLEQAT